MDCEIGDGSDKKVSRKLAFGFWGRERLENFASYFNYSLSTVPVVNLNSNICQRDTTLSQVDKFVHYDLINYTFYDY